MFNPFAYSTFFLLPLLLLHSLSSFSAAQQLDHICGSTGNFTANSTFQSNLKTLLSALASNAPASGFANASVGKNPEQVHGLVLCRGDVNATTCRNCLDTANQDAPQTCPFNKGAIVWYDFCFLRFSSEQFFDSTNNSMSVMLINKKNAPQPERFIRLRTQLLDATTDWAVNNATNRFASGQVSNFTATNSSVYGFVQCLPYMRGTDCRRCLRELFDPLPDAYQLTQGGRVLGVTCSMRYEIYPFLQAAPTLKLTAQNATEPAAAPAPPPPSAITVAPGGKEVNKQSTTLETFHFCDQLDL